MHSGDTNPHKTEIGGSMLALFPNHVFKNAAYVFAEWVQGYEEAQTVNVLIPVHLEMGSGWQGL